MKVRINNLLRIVEAEFNLAPGVVTTVSGPNASGKTSVATLTAAALAHQDNPLGASKGHGKVYLHDGADTGLLELVDDENVLLHWDGSGEFGVAPTQPRPSSPEAVGLTDFTSQIGPQARTALWLGLFNPDPAKVKQMVLDELATLISGPALQQIKEWFESSDDTEALGTSYEDRSRRAKSEWTGVTGETWGAKKAADWLPEGWDARLDGLTLADVELAVTNAKDAVTGAHVVNAVSVAEIEAAKAAKAKLPDLMEKAEAAKAAYSKATLDLEKYVKEQIEPKEIELRDLRDEWEAHKKTAPQIVTPLNCPHCDKQILVVGDELVPYASGAADEAQAAWDAEKAELTEAGQNIKAQIAKAEEGETPLKQAKDKASKTYREATANYDYEKRAAAKADETPTEDNAEAVREAQEKEDAAKRDFDLVKAREDAQRLHQNIIEYSAIAKVLGKQGVRARLIQAEIDKANMVLKRIAEVTGWPLVEIGNGYEVSIGGRKFMRVCAESERLRAQYSIQIAIARCKREPAVILDQADHLDTEHRPALFHLLSELCGRPEPPAFLVCGTEIDGPGLNPDGTNYRLLDGTVHAV